MTKIKKILILGLIPVIAIGAGGVSIYVLIAREDSKTADQGRKNQEAALKKACDIFTLHDAKVLLGDDIVQDKQETPDISVPAAPTSDKNVPPPVPEDPRSKDVKPQTTSSMPAPDGINPQESVDVSSCAYSKGGQADLLITLRRSTPEQLKKGFDAMRGEAAQKISDYGEDAYWRTGKDFSGKDFGQLVILDPAGLVMVSGSSNDLESYKKAAGVALANL